LGDFVGEEIVDKNRQGKVALTIAKPVFSI
jgi:hypothetical protein